MARKVRCLVTGKMYVSKKKMAHGKRLAKLYSKEYMRELALRSVTPEVNARRSESHKRFLAEHPGEISRRMTENYKKYPKLRKIRAERLEQTAAEHPEVKNHFTDAENAEKRRTYRDGRQVVRYVHAERRKSTGVVVLT